MPDIYLFFSFFLVFILGSAIGSFINVLIDRLPKGISPIRGRSHCDKCKKILTPFELFPIFSYLFLLGKCKKCHTKIPLRVFFVELLTAILFVILYSYFLWYDMPVLSSIYLFIVASIFISIFFIDLEHGIIPDELLIVLLFLVALFALSYPLSIIISTILSAVAAFLVFFFLFFITRGKGMGFGDVKLSFVLGLFLGFPNIIPAFYIAFLSGAIISLILVAMKKKKFRKSTIPFGPFMITAAFISFFFGNELMQFFIKFFSL